MQSVKEKMIPYLASPQRSAWTGKTLVLCHGTFDVVHPGHLEHLRQAKAQGDILVVSITADAFVNKGPGRPVFDEQKRADFLASLDMVDYVYINHARDPRPVIEALKPDVLCKGSDYAAPDNPDYAEHLKDKALVESYGGKVVLTNGFQSSSTKLINHAEEFEGIVRHSPTADLYLKMMRSKYSATEVLHWLDRLKGYAINLIGEPIIDKYTHVLPRGKSAKESIVVFEKVVSNESLGGISIIAEHLRAQGAIVSDANYYDDNNKRIVSFPAIVKHRYVEMPFVHKVFSVIERSKMETSPISVNSLPKMGRVLVADFGHGLIDVQATEEIQNKAEFLALTCQANSDNWGFNLLTKWTNADYVVCDEQELRLAESDRDGDDVKAMLKHQFQRMHCRLMVVTLGHLGCLAYDGKQYYMAPALADKVVDRMGAGDAFLAITTPLVEMGAPVDIVLLIGTLAAGIEVGQVGNAPVDNSTLRKWIKGCMG